jgi:hypothetical protein
VKRKKITSHAVVDTNDDIDSTRCVRGISKIFNFIVLGTHASERKSTKTPTMNIMNDIQIMPLL